MPQIPAVVDAHAPRPMLRWKIGVTTSLRCSLSVVSMMLGVAVAVVVGLAQAAEAQNVDEVIRSLEAGGWYIEPGGEGNASGFEDLVRDSGSAGDEWYFVSMAGPVGEDFADLLRDETRPTGNVLVYFVDAEGFLNVQLASGSTEAIEDQALVPFDDDGWTRPEEFMDDVVEEFERLTSPGADSAAGGGSGLGWLWIAIPVVGIGGLLFVNSRRTRKRDEDNARELRTKMHAAIQSELDELANDVLVLNGPVDLSDDADAIRHYREATATYTAISDEVPDLDELQHADLAALHDLGARVSHARWQMDAAEAIMAGDPIPEKPEVEPPPAPPRAEQPAPPAPTRLPQRPARPRVPYSRPRRERGGGLLDILIAGGSMIGRSRRRGGGMFGGGSARTGGGMFGGGSARTGGGMFGGGKRSTRSSRGGSNAPRPGGGVFGRGSRTAPRSRRSTSRSRTRSSSRSRSRSRVSSGRRSSSRRRRR